MNATVIALRQNQQEQAALKQQLLNDMVEAIGNLITQASDVIEVETHAGIRQEAERLTMSLKKHEQAIQLIRSKVAA